MGHIPAKAAAGQAHRGHIPSCAGPGRRKPPSSTFAFGADQDEPWGIGIHRQTARIRYQHPRAQIVFRSSEERASYSVGEWRGVIGVGTIPCLWLGVGDGQRAHAKTRTRKCFSNTARLCRPAG